MGRETTGGAVARCLHELRDRLEAAGFSATVETPRGGMPYVRVGNRHAPVLCEKIWIDRYRVDGDALWFFYSWGDPSCPAPEDGPGGSGDHQCPRQPVTPRGR